MNITEFFQLSAGKWFSQRTSHHLADKQTKGGRSDLRIEMLNMNDPTVVQLCQQYEVDPTLALCGSRVSWDGTMGNQEKQTGSTILVAIANPEKPNEGRLVVERTPVVGRYIMGTDDALTLITEHESLYLEERLWFASPNLRLRAIILKRSGGFSMTSFYSEIRMGGAQAAANAATTAQFGSKTTP